MNRRILSIIGLIFPVLLVGLIIFLVSDSKNTSVYYSIVFNTNGGNSISSQSVLSNKKIEKPNDPVKEGYVFEGWYYNDDLYDFNKPVKDDMTLYAKWSKYNITTYLVTFDSDGGSEVPSQEVNVGGFATRPEDPIREGYSFVGWYQKGMAFDFTTPVNENIELTAKWSDGKAIYIVTFKSNGGSDVVEQSVIEGEKANKPVDPTREGYVFNGWYLDGEEYDFNSPITGDITLDATWSQSGDSYQIIFNSDGGSSVPNQSVKAGGKIVRPDNPTKDGYTFDGWYYEDILYNFNTPVYQSMALTAKWIKSNSGGNTDTYTVAFNSDGGSNVSSQTVKAGGKVTKPSDPTRSGYTFDGWYYNGSSYNFNSKVNSNMTLTAKWKQSVKTYTVTFNSNGGSSIASQTIKEGGKVTKPSNPTRNGYTFDSWYYNGSPYNFNSTVNSNITLTAKWKQDIKTYTVTFNSNGGSSVPSQKVNSGNKATKPTTPTKSGYAFIGWYTSGRTEFNFGETIKSDITLSALWAPRLNYTKSTSGKWIFINNPEAIDRDDKLADSNLGNRHMYKTSFNGNAEIYFEHGVGSSYVNNVYYAIRFYNPSSTSDATLKINKCGLNMGWNFEKTWKQYYTGGCSLAGTTITIPKQRWIVIYVSGDNYVYRTDSNISGINKVSKTAFDGVLNVTSNRELLVATFAFKDYSKTFDASYPGNYTNDKISTRQYSGEYNGLPVVTNNMTFDIYNETPKGLLPVAFNNTNGTSYISRIDDSVSAIEDGYDWVTNSVGAIIENGKPKKYTHMNTSDLINLKVPVTSSSNMIIGPYDLYKEARNIIHPTFNVSMKGWSFNWGNWAIHYKENITIRNNTNSAKTVSFVVASLDGEVVSYYNGSVTRHYIPSDYMSQYSDPTKTNLKNKYTSKVWTVKVDAGKTVTVPAEITLVGSSNGIIVKRVMLEN